MNFFNDIFVCLVLTVFPLLLYFFYVGYNIGNNKKEDVIVFKMSIVASMYLLFYNGVVYDPKIATIFTNIPLLFTFVKKEKDFGFILSIFLIFYNKLFLASCFSIVSAQYIFLNILYIVKQKYKLSNFTFITVYFLSLVESYFTRNKIIGYFSYDGADSYNVLLIIIIIYFCTLFIIYMFKKGEEISKYHILCEEIVKQKNIRLSLYKITHEVKNPLAVVKGYLQIMKHSTPEKNEKYLPILTEEVDRALAILEDISAMTKLKIEKTVTRLDELLNDTVDMMHEIIDSSGIILKKNIENNIYTFIDEKRIKQVLINIIKNSIEELENKEHKIIKVTLETDKKNIVIKIEDNGNGVTKEELENIGKPLYTTKCKGTGLGIALSKEIINAHGGSLTYKSEYGKYMRAIIRFKK